jgi:transcriptional regulator with XRE-family HTH domain
MHLLDQLARQVRRLRTARGWTQQTLATHAGVPRATVTRLESAAPNPSFPAVAAVASALGVGLDELTAPVEDGEHLVPRGDLPTRRLRGVELRGVLPEPLPGVLLERMELAPGARHTGAPHGAGSREYLACKPGIVQLRTVSRVWRLEPGDVVVYDGAQPHAYVNPGCTPAVAYTVVLHGCTTAPNEGDPP